MKRYTTILLTALATIAATIGTQAQKIEIFPLEIFPGSSVINPFVCDSVLYFASDKKNDVMVNYFDRKGNRLYQIFAVDIVHKKPDGTPKAYLNNSNVGLHRTGIMFDNHKRAYITQNNPDDTKSKNMPLAIYQYSDAKQKHGTPVRVDQPAGTNNAYPSVSPDGQYMIFASDREGGYGSSDLYICYKNSDGSWTTPINMGPTINTEGAETSPYIHRSGKIFFSSNGREDSRKLDIYYTFKTQAGFAKPERFDIVVNSLGDDYGIYYSDNEEWGYVTSNRHGEDKLYFFRQQWPEFPEENEMIVENYCFTLYESSAENYDQDMFSFTWDFGDGQSARGIEVDHCFPGPGQYIVSLNVYDKTTNEELFKMAEYPVYLQRPVQLNIKTSKYINAGERAYFDADPSLITDFTPETYWWDFGNGTRIKGKQASIIFEKPGTYIVKCGVIAEEDPTIRLCTWIKVDVADEQIITKKQR